MAWISGARHHDVIDALFTKLQDILQDGTLGRGEIGCLAAGFAFERDLKVVAKRNGAQGQKPFQPLPYGGPPACRQGRG